MDILSKSDICKFLGISTATLDRMMKNGKIGYSKTSEGKSGRVFFYKSDLEKYLKDIRKK